MQLVRKFKLYFTELLANSTPSTETEGERSFFWSEW